MAASHTRNSISYPLYLLITLIILPSTFAQIITIGRPNPTNCVTAIATRLATICPNPIICAEVCIRKESQTLTQECGCPSPIPTAIETAPCGTCPGCAGVTILAPCTTAPPYTFGTAHTLGTAHSLGTAHLDDSCPVVTKTTGPGCKAPNGCLVPDCIEQKTVRVPCRCTGISTVTSCATTCPGCQTNWVGQKDFRCL